MIRLTFLTGLIFCFINYAASGFAEQELTAKLNEYFLNYYNKVYRGETIDTESILGEIKKTTGILEANNFRELTNKLNEFFLKKIVINIFLTPDGVINCWLGKLTLEDGGVKEIWGESVSYRRIIIDELIIHDYFYYVTKNQEQLEAVAADDLFFFNQEAFKDKAVQRWEFLVSRFGKRKISAYNPSLTDKTRRNLQRLSWGGLFSKGKDIFIQQAMDKFLEIALIHELGHLRADQTNPQANDEESEIKALLTELKYGPAPYESLNTCLSFAKNSLWPSYRLSGQYLISAFGRKSLKENLVCAGEIESLACLSEPRIKEIADEIYNTKI